MALETVSCEHVILSQITFKQSICVYCFCISRIVGCCYFSDCLMLLSIVKVRKTVLACLTSIFSLFVSSEHAVSNEHTAITENKRKIESEGRVFNSEWTNKYLFTVANSKILCLVRRNVVSVPKEYNLRRQFETNYPNLAELDTNKKSLKAESLLANLCCEQNFFKLPGDESVSATRVSFEISRKIAAVEKSLRRESLLKNVYHLQFL